jgi:hypothetical protein
MANTSDKELALWRVLMEVEAEEAEEAARQERRAFG